MKQHKFIGISLAAMVILAGCDQANMTEAEREVLRGNDTLSETYGSGVDDFGNWRKSNDAIQVVDPAPAYAEDPPTADGQIIISAYGRYRTGKVIPPQPIGTDSN